MIRNLSHFPTAASTRLVDAVHRYRRLPSAKKALIWLAVLIVSVVLLRPYHRPPPPRGPPPPFKPPFHGHPSLPPIDQEICQYCLCTYESALIVFTGKQRSRDVKATFQHAYGNYEQFAFGYDELRPLTNGTVDK
jgi:hypothetical protein